MSTVIVSSGGDPEPLPLLLLVRLRSPSTILYSHPCAVTSRSMATAELLASGTLTVASVPGCSNTMVRDDPNAATTKQLLKNFGLYVVWC
jgi:hypothetical protein